jgi:hypothetical protein
VRVTEIEWSERKIELFHLRAHAIDDLLALGENGYNLFHNILEVEVLQVEPSENVIEGGEECSVVKLKLQCS